MRRRLAVEDFPAFAFTSIRATDHAMLIERAAHEHRLAPPQAWGVARYGGRRAAFTTRFTCSPV
jgi:hypothetical protein